MSRVRVPDLGSGGVGLVGHMSHGSSVLPETCLRDTDAYNSSTTHSEDTLPRTIPRGYHPQTPAARSVKLRGVLVSKGEHCSLPLTSPRLPRCSLSFALHEDRTALFLPAAAGVPGRYGRVRAGSPSRRYSGAVLHLQRPRLAQCSLFTEASTPSRRARRPAFRRGENGNSPTRKRSLDELEHRRSSPPAHHSVAAMPLSRSYKVTRI